MLKLSQQQLGFFQTLKYSALMWYASILSLLPLILFAGLASGWPLYLKHFISPEDTVFFIITGTILALIGLVPTLGIFANLGGAIRGEMYSLSQSLAAGLLKLPSIILLFLMMMAILGLPFLAGIVFIKQQLPFLLLVCFTIWFILYIYLTCAIPLVVSDGLTPGNAIKTSFHLVKHHWWYVAGIMFLVVLFSGAVENVGRILFNDTGVIIAFTLVSPLEICARIIILQQLKIRSPH